MEPIEWINVFFSIGGAILFIIAFIFEKRIITLLNKIKKGSKWFVALILTGVFFFGYIANIYAVLTGNIVLQSIFTAIVYLFGGIFVVLVVTTAHSTYKAIFEAAERDLGEDLELHR
jgi:hypothetical protein